MSSYQDFFKKAAKNKISPSKEKNFIRSESEKSEGKKTLNKKTTKRSSIFGYLFRYFAVLLKKKVFLASIFLFFSAFLAFLKLDEIDRFISKLEISIGSELANAQAVGAGGASASAPTKTNVVGTKKMKEGDADSAQYQAGAVIGKKEEAEAEEEAKKKGKKGESAEEAEEGSEDGATPGGGASLPKRDFTVEEINHFSRLHERKLELDRREAELKRAEQELERQRLALENRIRELNEARRNISSMLEERVKVDQEKVDALVQLYSSMRPQQAAKVLETIEEDLAVEVLSKMKKKNAADIMNLLKPEKAQSISEKYAGFKR